MGKRKERRLAAMMAASRRVKLDLCAEPSGEMVGSSLHDEGGELDKDHQAGVPNSPSSSGVEISGGKYCLLGQKQENPLLLLGQYSDDELDEEASKQPKHAVEESSVNLDGQVQESADAGGDTGNDTEKSMTAGNVKQDSDQLDTIKDVDGYDAKESETTIVATQYNESDSATKTNPDASGMQIIGDMTGGWKVVMHEQSNQCYYWNTVTGQTSWEIPNELALGAGTSSKESSAIDGKIDFDVPAHTHSDTQLASYSNVLIADGHGGNDSISRSMETYGGVEVGANGEIVLAAYDVNQGLTHYNTSLVGISCEESSALSALGSLQQSALLHSEHMTNAGEECPTSSDEVKLMTRPTGCYETADVHSVQLVKYGENLLQRLKALEGSQSCLELQWIAKEIGIRISDCKALSSYGTSLLPFWWHTETQLKYLESTIVKGESSCLVQSKHYSKVETEQNPSWREERSLPHHVETGPDVVEKNSASGNAENNCSSLSNDMVKVQSEASNHMPETESVNIIGLSSCSVNQGTESEKEAVVLLPKVESHAEDVDMDVEMEVDEETVASQTVAEDLSSAECPAPTEQIIQSNSSLLECPAVPLDESSVPPPPDEEWIPPPPPDSEPVPPPPPEEPPVPAPAPFPPTYDNTLPPYQDQYNLAYTLPTYDYYAPVASEVTNANYYAQADGTHIAEPQQPLYYEPAVASAFPEVAADVNPAEPISYYDLSSGGVPHAPVVSSTASGFYVESAPVNYHSAVTTSNHSRSVGFAVDSERTSLPQVKPASDMSAVASKTETASVQAASIASMVQAAETALANGSATTAPSSISQKNQSKVVRGKKRTAAVALTLRSNKKVSSLVDKWKAAKEELHGEEDEESESAYEILGKKRQKEIEEWRARQIASGEAQDNANFLPLGGDWRERVKRRRAAAKSEAGEAPREEVVEKEKKQPDLLELSKDLPSGWQAYWDESTKEVYYGNSITSETTWTRPTR